MHWDCVAYHRHSCAMHLDCNAYDMHNCAMQSKNKQCIGIKLLMISIVVQCNKNTNGIH